MKYKEYGLNAEHIISKPLDKWAKESAHEFGFTEDEAKESYAIAQLEMGVTTPKPELKVEKKKKG